MTTSFRPSNLSEWLESDSDYSIKAWMDEPGKIKVLASVGSYKDAQGQGLNLTLALADLEDRMREMGTLISPVRRRAEMRAMDLLWALKRACDGDQKVDNDHRKLVDEIMSPSNTLGSEKEQA